MVKQLAIVTTASRSHLSCALFIFTLTCQATFAADPHRLELTDIPNLVGASELVSASDVAISPDGNWVAYTVTTTAIITQKTQQRLFVQPFEGGEPTQVGPQEADNMSPDWSPDGAKLLFFTTSRGHTSAAIWNVADKTAHVLDIAVRPWPRPEWLPDGERLLVALPPHEVAPAPLADSKTPAPIVFTASDTNRRLDGGHYLGIFSLHNSSESFDFAIADIAGGRAITVAANVDPNISNYQMSPDGTKVAYVVNKGQFEYDVNKRVLHDINVVDLRTESTGVVASGVLGWGGLPFSWSHDSKMLAAVGGTIEDDSAALPLGSRIFDRPGHCYVIDLKKPGVLRPVGPRIFWRDAKPMWGNDDRSIYAISSTTDVDTPRRVVKLTLATGAAEAVASLPMTFDLEIGDEPTSSQGGFYVAGLDRRTQEGRIFAFDFRSHEFTPVAHSNHTISSLSTSSRARVAYLAVGSTQPPNVWVSTSSNAAPLNLTHFDISSEQREKLGPTKIVSWEANGRKLYGTLWLPLNYREGQRYPTILDVYPGYQDTANFFRGDPFSDNLIWQAFSERGYAIFWPDFSLRLGDGPHEIAAQIIPALDKLVELGIADPNGFGVHGGSWGGYSTFSLITETKRFKAAITRSGYSNLLTAYGYLEESSSSTYNLGLLENDMVGVSPWQNRDLYIKNSPYFNFDKVIAPVLIEYGEKDKPFAWTSREAFVALRRLGKTATLLGYPDEGHGVNKPENQVDFTNRALDFFDQYLKRPAAAGVRCRDYADCAAVPGDNGTSPNASHLRGWLANSRGVHFTYFLKTDAK